MHKVLVSVESEDFISLAIWRDCICRSRYAARRAMDLRSGSKVGAGILKSVHRPQFEEGVKLLLTKWTALQLAVENQWGGRDSRDKAEDMYDEILEWFYKKKGDMLMLQNGLRACGK